MTLRDAIVHVDRELENEARRARTDKDLYTKGSMIIAAEHREIRATQLLETIKQGKEIVGPIGEWMDISMLMAFRFGMRVQRKLDNPDRETTLFESPCRLAGTVNNPSPDGQKESKD